MRLKSESELVLDIMSRCEIENPKSCWLWNGSLTKDGYGRLGDAARRICGTKSLHRCMYILLRGPIPDGLTLDHLCRVRRCANPFHTEPVTGRENILRGTGYAARNNRKTHCKHGHPLTGDNLLPRLDAKNGGRRCRICRNQQSFERMKKIRQTESGRLAACLAATKWREKNRRKIVSNPVIHEGS